MMLPSVDSRLPELMRFIKSLARDANTERLADQAMMTQRVRSFFTPAMMDYVEAVIPGWRQMASYADGQTLIHTITVFVALLMCPEYQQATPEQRGLMHWIVLLHDLAKVLINGKRDPTHSFRSAALAGKLLSHQSVGTVGVVQIAAWATLTEMATTTSSEASEAIQDNRQLPEITEGIGRLFGEDTAATLIIKAVLLHQSINVVSQWPQAAPMTDAEIQHYVSRKLLPLLKIMMLIDNDAWSFFDAPTKQQYRSETLSVFSQIERLPSFADAS